MQETPAERPWTPPVHKIEEDRADLKYYDQLYSITELLARLPMQECLRAITAESFGQDLTQRLKELHQFVSGHSDAPADEPGAMALAALDTSSFQALSGSLAAQVQKSSKTLKHEDAAADRKVAEQMSAELARSLWSTLLDHAARFAGSDGLVEPRRLLPTWPDGQAPDNLHDKLSDDLKHFSLSLEVLVRLSHTTLERLSHKAGNAINVQLPRSLAVNRKQLRTFLDLQKQRQLRAEQSLRVHKSSRGLQPSPITQPIRPW